MSIGHCKDLEDLASLLGQTWPSLSSYIYPKIEKNYRQFVIPKKNGGERHIRAPKKILKEIQTRLKDALSEYYTPYKCVHGFIDGNSIRTNSEHHVNKVFVLNVDLENFFETITFGRVRRLLVSRSIGLPKPLATVIAHICCFDGKLPQGAPTSPLLTNMICKRMDRELTELAEENSCYYTRYADDITFSFSHGISRNNGSIVYTEDGVVHPGHRLASIINSNGFIINNKKTRLQSNRQRQVVTGLVVNEKENVKREFLKQTMAMLYAWKKFGLKDAAEEHFTLWNKKIKYVELLKKFPNLKESLFSKIVAGRIAFISMVRSPEDNTSKRLLYELRELIGKPMPHLIKPQKDRLAENVFIITNPFPRIETTGTGFYLKGLGVITNQHVVDGVNLENVDVLDFRSDYLDSNINMNYLTESKSQDFALFQIKNLKEKFYGLRLAKNIEIQKDMPVIISGYPDYNPGEQITHIETKVVGKFDNIFGCVAWQVERDLRHGISGGPVFNLDLEVIGVATFGSKKGEPKEKVNGFIPISSILSNLVL